MDGNELRRLRLAHGLTEAQIGDILSISPAEVSRWEASPEIRPEVRRLFLRALAAWREAQRKAAWLVILLSADSGEPDAASPPRSLAGRTSFLRDTSARSGVAAA